MTKNAGSKNDNLSLEKNRTNLAVLVLSLNFGVVFFDRNAVGFLIPFIQPDLQLSNTQIGFLGGALALTWAISGYFIGQFADKHGKRKFIIVVSTIIFSMSSFISGMAWSFATLMIARLLMGLAEGGVMPVSQSLTADIVPEKHRGLAMGVMQAFGSNLLGGVVAPLLLVALASEYGWKVTFYLTALPGFLCAILILQFVPDPKTNPHAGDRSAEPQSFASLLKRNVVLCCIISICLVSYNAICWYFVPVFLTAGRGLSPETMSWLLATLGVSAVLTAFAVPALSDLWGRKPVMILFSFIGVLMPLSALFLPPSFVLLSLGFFIGWAILGVFPVFMSIIPLETVGVASAARVLGLVVGIGELLGGVLGPALAGLLADATSLSAPLWIMGGLAVLSGVLSFGLQETAPRKILE